MILRPMVPADAAAIPAIQAALGWGARGDLYERYLDEQASGVREVWVADIDGRVAGYLTIVWKTHYPPFAAESIPEIVDFNVWPEFQRRRIGTALMDHAEARIAERSDTVGIGVGLTPEYGPAQRLYVLRGYVPDGRGLTFRDRSVVHGDPVTVDDDLVLHLTKRLK